MIHRFLSLGSTNDQAQELCYGHGDVIVAERQTAGRGQRGHKWLSGEGENLTFSIVLTPELLETRRQFIISQAVTLGICDMLQEFGLEPRIKWTNDIYIGDKKIVGILIENRLSGTMLARSVVGIGINVNQREFDAELPNPTSMSLEAGQIFDRDEVLDSLVSKILSRVALIGGSSEAEITERYHSLLYRLGEQHTFRLASGLMLCGTIVGVAPMGSLEIEWATGERCSYLFGEVEFVIESRKDKKI